MSSFPLFWCALQVTLLAAAAISVSLLVVRRYPRVSVAATSAATLVILLSTMLLPLPVPQWQLPTNWSNPTSQDEVSPRPQGDAREAATKESASWLSLDLHKLAELGRGTGNREEPHSGLFWIQALVVACILFGSCRLLVAYCFVRKTLNSLICIENAGAKQILNELISKMKCRRTVALCVSDHVSSATVVGWLRPRIVLPLDWKSWSPPQLQAALAHELAHVVRNDLPWRVLASLIQVMHYYHPLAHWLWHRLTYSQEVAADHLAAITLGNRKSYYRALSELAIRQDDQSRLHVEPVFLPTLSSHLIRRIKMLRTTECRTSSTSQQLARLGVITLVALLGIGSFALRGLAQPLPETKLSTAKCKIFSRAPFMPLVDPENDKGIYLVKVARIVDQDSIKPYVPVLNRAAASAWQAAFALDALPEFDFGSIEYVTGQSIFKVKRLGKDSPHEHKNSIQVGTPYGLVRFKGPISHWEQWVRQNLPRAEELHEDDLTYFKVCIPAVGTEPCYITAYDEHTILIAVGEELLLALVDTEFQQQSEHWNEQWETLDEGLVSFVSADYEIESSVFESEEPESRAMDQIFDNIEKIGYSVDIDNQSGEFGLKIQLTCLNQEKVDLVTLAIREFTDYTLAQARELLSTLKEKSNGNVIHEVDSNEKYTCIEECQQAIDLLSNYSMRTIVHPNSSRTIDIRSPTPIKLKDLLGDILSEEELASKAPLKVTE